MKLLTSRVELCVRVAAGLPLGPDAREALMNETRLLCVDVFARLHVLCNTEGEVIAVDSQGGCLATGLYRSSARLAGCVQGHNFSSSLCNALLAE
jgi:hypothetical protein